MRAITIIGVRLLIAASLLGCLTPCGAQNTNGLVAWWRCDEGVGTNLLDYSGNGNAGVLMDGPGWAIGRIGGALNPNGGYVNIPNSPSLNVTTAITITAWTRSTAGSNARRILQKNSGGAADDQYEIHLGSEFMLNLSGVGSLAVTAPSLGVWHHVAGTYSGTNLVLYVDGMGVTQKVVSGMIDATSGPLNIARKPDGDGTKYFLGDLDDIRIYGRELSAAEIFILATQNPTNVVKGSVSYTGGAAGPFRVVASQDSNVGAGGCTAVINNPGPYSITNLFAESYYLRAYNDANSNGMWELSESYGSYTGNPISVLGVVSNINITVSDTGLAAISGSVSYAFSSQLQTGLIWVVASTLGRNFSTTLAQPGGFTLTNIPTSFAYTLQAFRDSNGNGLRDGAEAYGAYSSPLLLTENVSGLAISITDPDQDGDSMPDWWETLYGLNPTGSPGYMMTATVAGFSGTSQLSNFPVLVTLGTNLGNNGYGSFSTTNGSDLRIFTADMIYELPFEIEEWNPSGVSCFWVRMPNVTNGTQLVLKWGGAPTNAPAYWTNGVVWASEFAAAWHLGQTTGLFADATTNLNNGTANGSPNRGVVGKIGRAITFDGVDDYIDCGNASILKRFNSSFSLSAWIKPTSNSPSWLKSILANRSMSGGSELAIRGENDGANRRKLHLNSQGVFDLFGTSELQTGVWTHVGVTYTQRGGSTNIAVFYVNGILETSNQFVSLISDPGTNSTRIGWNSSADTTAFFCGDIDEVRIGLSVWPTEWFRSGYLAEKTNSTFLVYGLTQSTADSDGDGISDSVEYQLGSNPTNSDSDGDGLPDRWEVTYGTGIAIPSGTADTDGDGLINILEYNLDSNPASNDTDGDSLSDSVEYQLLGSSLTTNDTDGDGMSDDWEVAYGLNPLVNDANSDCDLDGMSNFTEYQNRLAGYLPNNAASLGNGRSDYENLYGMKTANYFCDKIDRLTGASYNHGSNGLSLGYVYDGNGNILRQIYLKRDQDHDGLPDLWEFQNGLSWTNPLGMNGPEGDVDSDNWSNYQEWRSGSNPTNSASVPDILGVSGISAATFQAGFVPSNFVMAVGDVDGVGAEEIVVGADGVPGDMTNAIIVLSQTVTGWATQKIEIGTVGVTSIAIGQPNNASSSSVYFGTRQAGGTGQIFKISPATNGWRQVLLPSGSTGSAAFVLGVRPGSDVLVQVDQTNLPPQSLFSLKISSNEWVSSLLSTNSSQNRGLGTLAYVASSGTVATSLRLLDSGGIQTVGSSVSVTNGLLITEQSVVNRRTWRGKSLDYGFPGRTNGVSFFSACLDDRNTNNIIDEGDEFVVTEFLINGTNIQTNTTAKIPLSSSSLVGSYALASANLTNGGAEIFFTGEPDGRIYSWTAANSSEALSRKLFDAHETGKAWHQFSPIQMLAPGVGLVGLRVDPTNLPTCDVVIWEPTAELWLPTAICQTAPLTRVMAGTNEGFGLSAVNLRIWDGEGNRSLPCLQYSVSNCWSNATVISLDGLPYSFTMNVTAEHSGSLHRLLWNTSADFGNGFVGTVKIRARSRDHLDWGPWSPEVPYTITVRSDSDLDGLPDSWELANNFDPLNTNTVNGAVGDADEDGVDNLSEYIADTDPNNADSFLTITGVRADLSGLQMNWKGGVMAWQYIQYSTNPASPPEQWVSVFTNPPPTTITNAIISEGATNRALFYRIKAERP